MKKVLMLIFWMSFTPFAFAHGGHGIEETIYSQMGIPIQIKQAKEFSRNIIIQFVQEGRLDKSWNDAQLIDAKTQGFNNSREWVVTYRNSNENDMNKKTIFLFLNEYGNSMGVTFKDE